MVPTFAYDYPNNVSADGIGNIKIGLAVDKVEILLHGKLGYSPYANHGCSTLTTKLLEPSGISFMIESKVLTRINLDYVGSSTIPEEIKTDTGVGLGATEETVLKAYPKAKVKPNPADPTWHTIFADAPNGTNAIVFETNGITVKSLRAGAYPSIMSPSGCG